MPKYPYLFIYEIRVCVILKLRFLRAIILLMVSQTSRDKTLEILYSKFTNAYLKGRWKFVLKYPESIFKGLQR